MIRFLFALFLLSLPLCLSAQFAPNPDWRFENFNSQNHFINNEILDLALDRYGYIWTCSRGLQRFDGYHTTNFNSFDQPTGGLRTNNTDVIADHNGRIWVNSSGLCYYDDARDKFIYVNTPKGRPINNVNSFLVQGSHLWFVCDYGLAWVDVNTLKITYTTLQGVINPLGTFLLDDHTLLISSREKTYTYDIKKNTSACHTLTYHQTLLKIYALVKKGPAVFLGTNHGLFAYHSLADVSPVAAIPDMDINDLLFMPQDKAQQYLFVAADEKGILVYNTASQKVEFAYEHNDNNPYSLPSNIISRFVVDRQNRVWMSTALGISLLDVDNQQWKMRYINQSHTDGLYISKIARDKYDSTRVWMSSFTRGMISLNWKTKKNEQVFPVSPDAQKLSDFEQLSKDKWLLATQQSLIEWSPGRGILFQTRPPASDSLGLSLYIRRIIPAGSQACYITTNRGLYEYNLLNHQLTPLSEKTTGQLDYDLVNGFEDKGILWIASKDGLFSYNTSTKATVIYKGKGNQADYYFFNIAPADGGQIVCAAGDGITIFNTQTKIFRVENTLAGFYKPDCENVMATGRTVWVNTEAGLLKYDLGTHLSEKAGYETPLTDIFPGSPFARVGNSIVLGFRNGFSYFTPGLKNPARPSAPVIEKVYVNNQLLLPQYPARKNAPKLILSYTNNSVNIAFTAFAFADPDHISFRYRLIGADSRWQYLAGQRNANYAQLPPGNYTFYVQTGTKNSLWNGQVASFGFRIAPPYWATWWFRLVVIIAIAFILYRLYRYQIKHILAIQQIREGIAADFHDEIGSALSSISIFSEVADQQLQQRLPREATREVVGHIALNSRKMLEAMDDIIWAVNPQNDHFNDLAVRMREFAIPLLEGRGIRFDMDMPGDILNTRVRMETRKNIFLIFKECLNNILKHAQCSAMTVTVRKTNHQLELVISDNGKGFDPDAPTTRNGLKNMHRRAAEINGTLQVSTQHGQGTMVRLQINII